MSAMAVCQHISILPLTWKHLIAFVSFHCSVSPSVVFFQILVTILNTILKTCWWKSHLAVFQNSTKSKDTFFLVMYREYEFHHMFWPTSVILGVLLRIGFMCNCPLECRLRPTNSFCSCHKLTLNPGVLMYIVSTLKHYTF